MWVGGLGNGAEEAAVEGDYLDLIGGQEDDVVGVVVAGGAEFDACTGTVIFAEDGTLLIQNGDHRIAIANALAEFDEDDVVFADVGGGHHVVFDQERADTVRCLKAENEFGQEHRPPLPRFAAVTICGNFEPVDQHDARRCRAVAARTQFDIKMPILTTSGQQTVILEVLDDTGDAGTRIQPEPSGNVSVRRPISVRLDVIGDNVEDLPLTPSRGVHFRRL